MVLSCVPAISVRAAEDIDDVIVEEETSEENQEEEAVEEEWLGCQVVRMKMAQPRLLFLFLKCIKNMFRAVVWKYILMGYARNELSYI